MASVEGTRRRVQHALAGGVLALATCITAGALASPQPAMAATDATATHVVDAFGKFMDTYWSWDARQFYWRSDHKAHNGNRFAPMWWTAQLWEALMDNYERTSSSVDRQLIDVIYEGWVQHHNGIHSDYNDDLGWWALAATRAFSITHENRYLNVAIKIADSQWNRGTARSAAASVATQHQGSEERGHQRHGRDRQRDALPPHRHGTLQEARRCPVQLGRFQPPLRRPARRPHRALERPHPGRLQLQLRLVHRCRDGARTALRARAHT